MQGTLAHHYFTDSHTAGTKTKRERERKELHLKLAYNKLGQKLYCYRFETVAGVEEEVTVPPAALERLLRVAGVVVQQMLLQVLHYTKDERASMPLPEEHKSTCQDCTNITAHNNITTPAQLHITSQHCEPVSYPAAVILDQIQPDSLYTSVITACVDLEKFWRNIYNQQIEYF